MSSSSEVSTYCWRAIEELIFDSDRVRTILLSPKSSAKSVHRLKTAAAPQATLVIMTTRGVTSSHGIAVQAPSAVGSFLLLVGFVFQLLPVGALFLHLLLRTTGGGKEDALRRNHRFAERSWQDGRTCTDWRRE